jgi:hypothetical protein
MTDVEGHLDSLDMARDAANEETEKGAAGGAENANADWEAANINC